MDNTGEKVKLPGFYNKIKRNKVKVQFGIGVTLLILCILLSFIFTLDRGSLLRTLVVDRLVRPPFAISLVRVNDTELSSKTIDSMNEDVQLVMERLANREAFRYYPMPRDAPCPIHSDELSCSLDGGNCHLDTTLGHIPDDWNYDVGTTNKFVPKSYYENFEYIDIVINPERTTGYKGKMAGVVWKAALSENTALSRVPTPDDMEPEERVIYRLADGVYASVTSHIAEYTKSEGQVIAPGPVYPEYYPNIEMYRKKVGGQQNKLLNLYYSYLFVARAIARTTGDVLNNGLQTGNTKSDALTRSDIFKLLSLPLFNPITFIPFGPNDELLAVPAMLSGYVDTAAARWRNISELMQCVGCEVCRLHASVYMRGLATAMDVMYSNSTPQLSRMDVVSMIQVLHKFSHALHILDAMRERDTLLQFQSSLKSLMTYVFVGVGGVCVGWIMNYSRKRLKRRKSKATKKNEDVAKVDAAVSPGRPKDE